MATLVMIGSSETRWVARDGGRPWMLTPRSYGARPMSLDPGQRRGQVGRGFGVRSGRATHDDDGHAEAARRLDLGVSRRAAAVLGDEKLDALFAHQPLLVGERERAARQDQLRPGQGVDLGGAIDRANDVAMLRGASEGGELQAPLRQQDRAPFRSERIDRRLDRIDFDPVVARLAPPRRTREDEQRHARRRAGLRGIVGNLLGERMRRVDDRVDRVAGEIVAQALDAAEAADAARDRRRLRVFRAAGEREDRRDVFAAGDARRPARSLRWFRRE